MGFEFWQQMLLKFVEFWQMRLCWMSGSHRILRFQCILLHAISLRKLDLSLHPILVLWNPIGQHRVFPSSTFLSSDFKKSLQSPTSMTQLFLPITFPPTWTLFSYSKNGHSVSCDPLIAKYVSLCRIYCLDKGVRVVFILLLLWFWYHSAILRSNLSSIFESRIFV